MEKVTHLICVSDQSRKGLEIIKTIREVADRLVLYDEIGVIINRALFPERLETVPGGVPVAAVIPPDQAMAENDIEGRSIFMLPEDALILKGAREALLPMKIL